MPYYPRKPSYVKIGVNKQTLLEISKYYDYAKHNKRAQFEVRIRLTAGQIARFGGTNKLSREIDEFLLNGYGIYVDSFSKSVMGFRTVEGQPTEFGSYQIFDVLKKNVYPKSGNWGSLKRLWS